MLTKEDLSQLKDRGIDQDLISYQIQKFESGFPYLHIMEAATIGNGIMQLEESTLKAYIQDYQERLSALKVVKFVPASGAASRMYKDLFACLQEPDEQLTPQVQRFFDQLTQFAFYPLLKDVMTAHQINLDDCLANRDHHTILRFLLTNDGLDYGSLPKGLLAFHSYGTDSRTPMEEHLVEAAHYARSTGKAYLHFTVSPQHQSLFEGLLNEVQGVYEQAYQVSYNISFSRQHASTDTIAVDLDNQPFRNPDDSLLFRPGGHGALLENLNGIKADLIFIKNIDNVVPDRLKATTDSYKKALAGVLIAYQKRLFEYLQFLDTGVFSKIDEIERFLNERMNVKQPEGYAKYNQAKKVDYLRAKLHRPIRVCGMVKNEGEPGGGPFWAQNKDNSVSLQIVESSQIDLTDQKQQDTVKNATHFNPVDLVCGVKDHRGNKFDLLRFRDPDTGFISEKSKDGKTLKAMELPGLWNGAMADWHTLFVEVPLITFNPVKTVNDLLREEHQEA